MEIRTFAEDDAAAVIALWTEVFGYGTPHNDPAMAIRRKLAFQRELFFVADVDGQVIGTIIGGYDGHRGWMYSLAVDPRFRDRGIGRALVRHVEDALAELGCLKVNLQVMAGNEAVAGFYEKLGYKTEPRISMGKVLDASMPADDNVPGVGGNIVEFDARGIGTEQAADLRARLKASEVDWERPEMGGYDAL